MLNVFARASDLPLDVPLPFDLYDGQGRLIVRRGTRLRTTQEQARLLRLGARRPLSAEYRFCHELSAKLDAIQANFQPMDHLHYASFPDLRLLPGTPMLARIDEEETPYIIHYIGMARLKAVLVESPERGGEPAFVPEGAVLRLCCTSSQYLYHFSGCVISNATQPYAHLHLSHPSEVLIYHWRHSQRHPVQLPATLTRETGETIQGMLKDLSLNGACFLTAQPLEPGERLTLRIPLPWPKNGLTYVTQAEVRTRYEPSPSSQKDEIVSYGLAFIGQDLPDLFLLMSYFATAESPRRETTPYVP